MSDTGTVSRVLRLISLLTDHTDISAKEAAVRLGWPVSTTHRLLRMLAAAEYARQKESGRFGPGLELFRIAGRLGVEMPYAQIAEPLLAALTGQFNETSLLTILERRQLKMYVALSAAPQDPMRYNIELNRRGPLAWGASGHALLAHMRPEEVEQVIATCNEPNARGEPLDAEVLRAALRHVLEQGYAVTISHRVLHAVGVAAPFFDVRGEVVGSVAFQVPQFRYDPDVLPAMVNALKQTAAVISQQLGSLAQR